MHADLGQGLAWHCRAEPSWAEQHPSAGLTKQACLHGCHQSVWLEARGLEVGQGGCGRHCEGMGQVHLEQGSENVGQLDLRGKAGWAGPLGNCRLRAKLLGLASNCWLAGPFDLPGAWPVGLSSLSGN